MMPTSRAPRAPLLRRLAALTLAAVACAAVVSIRRLKASDTTDVLFDASVALAVRLCVSAVNSRPENVAVPPVAYPGPWTAMAICLL